MKSKRERQRDCRVEYSILDDVCLDCGDFLNHPCVDCKDCPVGRLKIRLNDTPIKDKEAL